MLALISFTPFFSRLVRDHLVLWILETQADRHRQRDRDREGDRDRPTDRQTDRQIDRQTETDRQTDTDRQTGTDRERERHTETDFVRPSYVKGVMNLSSTILA